MSIARLEAELLEVRARYNNMKNVSLRESIAAKHLLRVGNPRLYDRPYHSPRLPLWEPGEVERFVILRADPPHRRRKPRRKLLAIPLPLLREDGGA